MQIRQGCRKRTLPIANLSIIRIKMQTPRPVISTSDQDAEAAAAAARAEGTAMIRDHLNGHLQQNPIRPQDPVSSYVTWIATLHPENATVSVDPRFLIPGNPWMTVFEDAKAGPIPVAQLVQIDEELSPSTQQQHQVTHPPSSSCEGNIFTLVIGYSISLSAVAAVIAIELAATVVYLTAAMFFYFCKLCMWKLNIITVVPFATSYIVWRCMALTDFMLLLVSVIVSEILALTCSMCNTIFGGCQSGAAWHQHIRRVSHLSRWAFRYPFDQWNPPRDFPCKNVLTGAIDEASHPMGTSNISDSVIVVDGATVVVDYRYETGNVVDKN